MKISFTHENVSYEQFDVVDAQAIGVPQAVIGRAIKDAQSTEMRALAGTLRARFSKASAEKLAEYRIKETIAANKSDVPKEELALLTREAKARGLSLDELLASISTKAATFRQAALLVATIEAEGIAAIERINDDDAEVEAKTIEIIKTANQQAETAWQIVNKGDFK